MALKEFICFSNKNQGSFVCGIVDCECTIHFYILIFCYLNEWTMWTHAKEVDAYLCVSSLTILFCIWADFFEVNRKFNVVGELILIRTRSVYSLPYPKLNKIFYYLK